MFLPFSCLFRENPQSKADSYPQCLLACIKVFPLLLLLPLRSPREIFFISPLRRTAKEGENLRFFRDSVIDVVWLLAPSLLVQRLLEQTRTSGLISWLPCLTLGIDMIHTCVASNSGHR